MYLIDGAALLVVEAAVREHQLEVGQNLILRPAARFLNLLEDKFKTSWQKTCVTDPDLVGSGQLFYFQLWIKISAKRQN